MPPGGEVNITSEAATSVSEKRRTGQRPSFGSGWYAAKEVIMKATTTAMATENIHSIHGAMPFAADGIIFSAEEVDRRNRSALSAARRGGLVNLLYGGEYSSRLEYLDDVYSDVIQKIDDEWYAHHQRHSWLWWAQFVSSVTGCAVAEEERRYFRRYLLVTGMVRLGGFFRLRRHSSRIRDARWNE